MAKKIIPVQNKMFIFCEGDKTEPLYISSYIDDKVKTKTKVIKIPKTKKNTPVQLVEEAISVKKSNKSISGDEFWVVYDREA
ncbi:RloB family protein, partial [Shigella sonnei]|uniref:RloB family protein n=1 Tax=Shigella sonnei TaxID=624 RepID=UPI0011157B43